MGNESTETINENWTNQPEKSRYAPLAAQKLRMGNKDHQVVAQKINSPVIKIKESRTIRFWRTFAYFSCARKVGEESGGEKPPGRFKKRGREEPGIKAGNFAQNNGRAGQTGGKMSLVL